jgi:fumarate hydratase class I
MIEIQACKIVDAVKELILDKSYHLTTDVRNALENAAVMETDSLPKYILSECITNFQIADKGEYPLCQDTGTALFFIELGADVHVIGNLKDAINKGVREAYDQGYLRKSQVDDPIFDRINTKDNTPAVIYVDFVPGDKIKISFLAKGGGAENCCTLGMLTPSQGVEGVIDFVVETVRKAGGKPCPPIIVGIGIGGTADSVNVLSKRALLKKIGKRHRDPRYSKMEQDILEKINALGIGAQGLGGKTTALDVHIETAPCHIASLPVSVAINCHSSRHGTIIIDKDQTVFEKDEKYIMLSTANKVSNPKKLILPLSFDAVRELNVGDVVSISGTVYTARDAAHKRLMETIQNGEKVPFDMLGQAIYYAGPSPSRVGKPIGSCGPTTSFRMDSFSEIILQQGLRIMIGKGPRTPETISLMQKYGAVYLANIGGAAAVTATKIKNSEIIAYEDLGPEAICKLEVKDFICIVTVDSFGRSLYIA